MKFEKSSGIFDFFFIFDFIWGVGGWSDNIPGCVLGENFCIGYLIKSTTPWVFLRITSFRQTLVLTYT